MTTPVQANTSFNLDCKACLRLVDFLMATQQKYPHYFCKPVPAFGDSAPKLLIVGLAPGMHGANQTGRPFTGDYAGVLLYDTLHQFGFATKPVSVAADDDLQLIQCRITNAVKCLPPENKVLPVEIANCNTYLKHEIAQLEQGVCILALGQVAHTAVLKALQQPLKHYPFGHGTQYDLPNGMTLISSYHCSKYNTQTKRLTVAMFHAIFLQIRAHISQGMHDVS